ncbi:MAG: 4-(cytidine 5'-diphospho)-2-C-methyl-D-erythritol kinase [Lacibacter sp.]
MIVFPNCKINLGLQILNKREDGFHNLETVFYPIPLRDALEVIRLTDDKTVANVNFKSTGLTIEGDSHNNLCIKAYDLLKKDFPALPSIQMHLHKTIPMGAGLGGGSSDGAFALKLLNEKFQLGLSIHQLINYALQLGSDCPFFIINKPAFATGRGELLEEISLDLSAFHFAIVNPGIHVNTGWAFAQLNLNNDSGRFERPDSKHPVLKTIIQQPISTWKNQLINDFEEPVSKAHPEIAFIKQQLYDAGALYASMTGSGSTVYGIFSREQKPSLSFPSSYFCKLI